MTHDGEEKEGETFAALLEIAQVKLGRVWRQDQRSGEISDRKRWDVQTTTQQLWGKEESRERLEVS